MLDKFIIDMHMYKIKDRIFTIITKHLNTDRIFKDAALCYKCCFFTTAYLGTAFIFAAFLCTAFLGRCFFALQPLWRAIGVENIGNFWKVTMTH